MCAHAVILQLFVKIIFPPKFDNKQTNSLLRAFFFFSGIFQFYVSLFHIFHHLLLLKKS